MVYCWIWSTPIWDDFKNPTKKLEKLLIHILETGYYLFGGYSKLYVVSFCLKKPCLNMSYIFVCFFIVHFETGFIGQFSIKLSEFMANRLG